MTAPDILAQDLDDAAGVAALVAAIMAHVSQEERQQFDADLQAWNCCYAKAICELAQSAEWQEIEQWRKYLLSLPLEIDSLLGPRGSLAAPTDIGHECGHEGDNAVELNAEEYASRRQ